ncbi:GntR family transcriptional regulator [Acetobacter conturbans]|uniref:GntR family transcriptional regulator n=1 Tax=Acetobacter conturbans TaxID=1737472 RepID=UPI001568927E|nr:GntR family transcriptional regulator [Acetobacter conturbans]
MPELPDFRWDVTAGTGRDGRLQVRTIADRLYHLLRERIIRGEFQGHETIRQDVLAGRLGISKIPLREALARLEQDGLVSSQVNRGFMVTSLTREEAAEVFTLRLRLEPEATVDGSIRANHADQDSARKALQNLEEAWKSPSENWGDCNRAFHLALMRPGTGTLSYSILERLHVIAERYVLLHLEPPSHHKRAAKEHRTLFNLWLKRDVETLRQFVHTHIFQTQRDLVDEMEDLQTTASRSA